MTLVRYYGHVGVPSGYGDAASETCMAILDAGLELEISTDGTMLPAGYLPLATRIWARHALSQPDVVIIHTLPLDCARVLASERIRDLYPRALCICYTTWEGSCDVSPEVLTAMRQFDQVWVPSGATFRCASCLLDGGPRRIGGPRLVKVPHAFDDIKTQGAWPGINETLRPRKPSDDIYRFYYIGAWQARKNVDGLIRAYANTFTSDNKVELVIQAAGAPRPAFDMARLACGVSETEMPRIRFSNERLSAAEISRLHAECDCFVTASRGEAWNLPAFDAMIAARHIIAPANQGSDEFLQWTSAWRYDGSDQPAFGDVRIVGHGMAQFCGPQGLSARSLWIEPDLGDLGLKMCRAYEERVRYLSVFHDPAHYFGRKAVGRLIRTLIEGALQ